MSSHHYPVQQGLIHPVDSFEVFFEFITYGVLLNTIGSLGLIGNLICLVILSRPAMQSSINYLLKGLVKCDTVLIVTSILLFGFPGIFRYTGTPLLTGYYSWVFPLIAPVVYPLALIAQTVSVYITLTVTIERFIAVCHPLQARSMLTYGKAKRCVMVISTLSFVYNCSRFLEVSVTAEVDPTDNSTVYSPVPTDLRKNKLYITLYINWFYLIFIYFLPFSLLVILNAAIYHQVRAANRIRQRLSRRQKKEVKLTTMLLVVVLIFIICNVLALVTNVLEAFYGIVDGLMVKLSNLLITINSSVNFIIYVAFGGRFKKIFWQLFCLK